LLIRSSTNASSFRHRLNIIDGKLKTNHSRLNLLAMLESTLGINFAVVICICYIINGLCLHCFTLKWFFEDITNHLFHFLDDDHIHETCDIANNFTQNNTHVIKTNDKHVLFKSDNHLILTEQLINASYFFYLSIVTLFLAKIKSNDNCFNTIVEYMTSFKSKNNARNERVKNKSTSSFINSVNESPLNVNLDTKQIRNKFYRNLIASFVFFILLICILAFTYSVSTFSLQVKCEEFFKNNSKMVRI